MKCSLYLHVLAAGLTVLVCGCSLARSGSRTEVDEDASTHVDNAMDGAADAGTGGVSPQRDSGTKTPDSGSPLAEDARDVVIGRYAERRAFRTIQRVMSPIFNDEVHVLTTSYSLVEVQKKGNSYLFRENACRVVVENEGSFAALDVSIDDQVPQSIPQIESELRVEEAAGNITWVRPLTSAPVGFIPNNPSDRLPTTTGDPRVRDSEGDGNPGVSAYVKANLSLFGTVEGTLYLVQWNRARHAGTRRSDGSLEGENFDTSEQNVIGSDNPMLANNSPPIVPDPNIVDNRILLVPLSAPTSCAALLGQLETLFF